MSARNYAVWLLGRREWSRKELLTRLTWRGYSPEEAQEATEFCDKHGFQSDARFADSRARSRSRQYGNRRIVQELKEKGLAPDLLEASVADLEDENNRALRASKKFSGKPLDAQLNAKVWRFLMARGFSSDAIKFAIRELKNSGEAPAGPAV